MPWKRYWQRYRAWAMLVTFRGAALAATHQKHSKTATTDCSRPRTCEIRIIIERVGKSLSVIPNTQVHSQSLLDLGIEALNSVELPLPSTLVSPQHHISSAFTRLRQKHKQHLQTRPTTRVLSSTQ
ncbi:hypothetical protein DE146DRAFT_23827 [Phaeosphaeria sp. MPI-PUGE-AT-0046c]|nr:hypothetical protein DE146DRAFT_23827 [Phaeosphaeria sp. MPI-PUGE-AT-0046c]